MRVGCFCAVLFVALTSAHGQGFTVEQALSAPCSNQLTAAPAKARVAWFTDAEGRRNVWVAGAQEAAKQVTHNTQDDGQDMDELAWSADAEQLAWTRGTGAQPPEHPVANPAELPGPVTQNIEVADLRSGAVHVIAEGHSPLFLRDGSLLFLRGGQIWLAPPATPARQLVYLRGKIHGLRLSPDGASLAFVSERGDHSFIGLYIFATRAVRWVDPGTGLDHDPVWSPDSKRIAFIREVPVVSPIAERWMREGAPWSIRVADTQSETGIERWHADAGAGSIFHAVTAKDQLVWLANGLLVFPWEKDGWTRLYSIDLGQSAGVKLLTPGELEVDAVASDGRRIVFTSNQVNDDARNRDRRHLWVTEPGRSSRPGELVVGKTNSGIEADPAILSDGTLVCLEGDAQQPFVPVSLSDHGSLSPLYPRLVPRGFPGEQFVTPEQVVFKASDGAEIHGQLFLPKGKRPEDTLPAVVFLHGGPRRQMLLGFNAMQYYAQAYEFNQYLCSRGFVVLSVNYRSGTGYGLNFRQALNYGANGASEYNDVVGAAKYLRSRKDVDAHRIAAWGGSYGGYLTALALARSSDLYVAGVDLHGVHDWSLELDLWKPTDDPDTETAVVAKKAFESSPMAAVKRWRSPVLLIAGDDDRNVLFAQTVRLAAALRAQGVHVEEKVFPDEVHDFLLHRHWVEAYSLAAAFLEQNLRPQTR